MKITFRAIIFCAALAFTFSALQLRADDTKSLLLNAEPDNPFYVKVGGAALFEQKVNIQQVSQLAFFQNNFVEIVPGPAQTSTGVPNTGGGFDVTFGYRMTRSLAIEFESGEYWNSMANDFTSTVVTNGLLVGTSGSAFQSLDQQQVPLMVNLVYHFNPDGRWNPYVGVGAGGLVDIVEFKSDLGEGTATDANFGFAGQVQAGCSYRITKHASVDADYKFLFANNQNFQAFGEPVQFQGVCEHLFQLSLDWRF